MKRNDCLKNLVRLCLLVCGWLLGACLLTACQGNGGGTETRMPDTSTATDSPVTLPATDTDSATASETQPATGTDADRKSVV